MVHLLKYKQHNSMLHIYICLIMLTILLFHCLNSCMRALYCKYAAHLYFSWHTVWLHPSSSATSITLCSIFLIQYVYQFKLYLVTTYTYCKVLCCKLRSFTLKGGHHTHRVTATGLDDTSHIYMKVTYVIIVVKSVSVCME